MDNTQLNLGKNLQNLGPFTTSTGPYVTVNGVQILSNKSLVDSSTWIVDAADPTKRIAFDAAGSAATTTTIAANQTANRVVALPDADTTLVGRDTTDTLTNKNLADNSVSFVDATDPTKKIILDAAGTTGTTTTLLSSQTANRVLTMPNATGILALTSDLASYVTLATTQTISGLKTFSNITQFQGGMSVQSLLGGSWINMPTTGPSAIGHGGAGTHPWIARANNPNEWFNGSIANDICYRNTAGKILMGCIEILPTVVITNGPNLFRIQNVTFGPIITVKTDNTVDCTGIFNFTVAPNISTVTNGAASLTMPGSTGTIALTSDVDQSCAWFGCDAPNGTVTPIASRMIWYPIEGTYVLAKEVGFSAPTGTALRYDGISGWFNLNYTVSAHSTTECLYAVGIALNGTVLGESQAVGSAPAGTPTCMSRSFTVELQTNDVLTMQIMYMGAVAEDVICDIFSMQLVEIK